MGTWPLGSFSECHLVAPARARWFTSTELAVLAGSLSACHVVEPTRRGPPWLPAPLARAPAPPPGPSFAFTRRAPSRPARRCLSSSGASPPPPTETRSRPAGARSTVGTHSAAGCDRRHAPPDLLQHEAGR